MLETLLEQISLSFLLYTMVTAIVYRVVVRITFLHKLGKFRIMVSA